MSAEDDRELLADLTGHVERAARAQAAAVERACEAALQLGDRGVLVDADGVRPDERVPYGRIYYVRGRLDPSAVLQ